MLSELKSFQSIGNMPVIDGRTLLSVLYEFYNYMNKRDFTYTKTVKKVSDFGLIENNQCLLDENTGYFIDGNIDMEGVTLLKPSGKVGIGYLNGMREYSSLYCTENNYTMFENLTPNDEGNLKFEATRLTVTGTGSKIFDLTNDGSGVIEFFDCNFGRSASETVTSLGTLKGFRQMLINTCSFFKVADGFTIDGTWSGGIKIETSNSILIPAGLILLKAGASCSVREVVTNMKFESVDASAQFTNFAPANVVAEIILNSFRTTATNPIPNIPYSNIHALYDDKSRGVRPTKISAKWRITSAVATTISTINTATELAGTTTEEETSTHFQLTGNNSFKYIGLNPIKVEVTGVFNLTATNGNSVKIYARQYDDSASSYVANNIKTPISIGMVGSFENATYVNTYDLETNDIIKFFVENSALNTVTAQAESYIIIKGV